MMQQTDLERTLRVLEFTKIRDMLASLALTELGKACCLALEPASDMADVVRMQAETEEASVVMAYTGSNPTPYTPDVRGNLKRAAVGATLGQKALLVLTSTILFLATAESTSLITTTAHMVLSTKQAPKPKMRAMRNRS